MENKESKHNRRKFLENVAMFGAMTAIFPFVLDAKPLHQSTGNDGEGYTFLFQGDSITDGGRSHDMDWNHIMGQDYAYLISSRLWLDYHKKRFQFLNRGTGGSKLFEMASRWQKDAIDLKPDLISILIGINDISTLIRGDSSFTSERYENEYRALLEQTKQALPNVQLVLGEPFVLPGAKLKDKYNDYSMEAKKRQAVVKKLSEEFDAIFIPYQSVFDKALTMAPVEYWIWDGIHPMPAGHEMMAREWILLVSQKLRFIKRSRH